VCLHVLADRPVVSDQLLEHQVRRTGDWFVLVLHAAHRIECLARGACREHLGADEHRRYGGQAQDQPPADA
jgi:hypothetical protein